MDLDAAEAAAAGFLRALGVGLDSAHLMDTPGRMARAWAEMLTARPFAMTTFPNEEGYDELVLARDIPFRSACTRDRVGRDEFGLTQEFFAQMLGVRRPAASGTARQLHAAGLISYRCVTITDPPTPWTS